MAAGGRSSVSTPPPAGSRKGRLPNRRPGAQCLLDGPPVLQVLVDPAPGVAARVGELNREDPQTSRRDI